MTSNIDEQVRQAMRAVAGGIEPPVQELVDEGLARGRRLFRRHRITTMAGGSVTAAAMVAAAVFLVPQVLPDSTAEDLGVTTGGGSEAKENPAKELAERELEMRAGEKARPALETEVDALVADLGPGWTAHTGPGFDLAAMPTDERREGLPDGYEYATVVRDVGDEIHCQAGEEKGTQVDACVEVLTTPDAKPVYVRWGRTLIDHPNMNYAGASVQDDLWVFYEQDDGAVVTVRLWVAEPIEQSTPDRRVAATEWMEQQQDALIAAATVGDLQRSHR
jgi:hypothetical protein